MTHIHLQIPDDLQINFGQMADKDVETFVIMAIRHELDRKQQATDTDIENATIADMSSDFLTSAELSYYLHLPNHLTR